MIIPGDNNPSPAPQKRKYVRAVGPRLRILLRGIFVLVALLGANSLYLTGITVLEWSRGAASGVSYENYFYQYMFLAHLALGLLLLIPFIIFGALHIKNAHDRPNRHAVRVGYALFAVSLVLLFTGVALMRVSGLEIRSPHLRSAAYWAHVITPCSRFGSMYCIGSPDRKSIGRPGSSGEELWPSW